MDKIEKLDQLISEVLGGGKLNLELVTEEESPVKSGEQTERRVLKLPQYRVSETWGDPKSEDRVVISRFMAQVPGENLQEKFNSLSNFITKCKEECVREKDTPKIIANLIVLNSLAAMITDFNKQTAGFLMEAFLAALLGGDAKQLSLADEGSTDIADIVNLQGVPTSVKFLSPRTVIKGSTELINKYFAEDPSRKLRYLLLQKFNVKGEVMGIKVYEFFITGQDSNEPNVINFNQERYLKNSRFEIPQKDVISGEPYATLPEIRKDEIRKLTESYVSLLQSNVVAIFDALDSLNTGVEDYLITNEASKGKEAQVNAGKLIATVEKTIKNT